MASALLGNPHLDLGPYLHKLMPAALTVLLTKRLGASPLDYHWPVRDQAAGVSHLIFSRAAAACLRGPGAWHSAAGLLSSTGILPVDKCCASLCAPALLLLEQVSSAKLPGCQ